MTRKSTAGALALGLLLILSSAVLRHVASHLTTESATPLDGYERVAHVIDRASFLAARPEHRAMLVNLARAPKAPRPAVCFLGAVPAGVQQAFEQLLAPPEFQLGSRWSATATNGGGLNQGDPTVITYSFAPDGTSISSGVGEPAAPSSMFAAFNGAFGSQATWQNLVHQVFARWSEVSGLSYVYEPNDDGSPLSGANGLLGVRGDVRIGGHFIDGGGGILAYNSFPNNGDMVLDTGDTSFFGNSGSNYRRFRNTVAHEHGHGIGLGHVCPSNQTKLMEPFISTAYDGPQSDDILGAHRGYGDIYEANDSVASATDLGVLGTGTSQVLGASVDDNADVDYYRFTVASTSELDVVLRPIGSTYNEGGQNANGSCGAGTPFDSLTLNDVNVEVIDQNGTTVLGTAASQPAGVNETLNNVFLPSGAGPYYIRVTAGLQNAAQRYELDLNIQPSSPPAFSVDVALPLPILAEPGFATAVRVLTTNLSGAPDPANGQLFASINGGPFLPTPLVPLGGGQFAGLIPGAPCFANVEWFVSLFPMGGGAAISSPFGAPASATNSLIALPSGPLIQLAYEDFETQPSGWTVTNDASLTGGAWQRGVPVGGGTRGDPVNAFSGSACYLTENAAGNSDVDGGATYLTSPSYDLSAQTDARVVAAIWFDNDFGSNPGTDPFLVQASDDGGANWTTLEIYNESPDVWVQKVYYLQNFIALTSQVRVRFVAMDPAPGSVVEAGVDAFRIQTCATPSFPTPTLTGAASGSHASPLLHVNGSDGGAAYRVDVPTETAWLVELRQPATNPQPAGFLLFAQIGVPNPADVLSIPGLGDLVFIPCPIPGASPTNFVLADGFGTGLCAGAPSAPTPFNLLLPGIPVTGQLVMQAVIDQGAGSLAVTNGLIVNFF